MQIEDYDAPVPLNAAIDPRASQRVAAQHRAAAQPGRPSHDTEPITPLSTSPLPARAQALIGGVLAVLFVGGLVWATSWQLARKPVALQISPIPSQTMGSTPVLASAPPVQPTGTPAATINAYDAPDGRVIGPISPDRALTPLAHSRSDWVQVDAGGTTHVVWLRARDVPDVAIVGPDLAPVAQTGRGLTVDAAATPEPPEAAPEPAATPAPALAPVVDAPLKVRAEDDCSAEHGRCDPPCTAEHGRCSAGDK